MNDKAIAIDEDNDYELYANIDWITVTTREDKIGRWWQELYMGMRKEAEENRLIATEKRWSLMSYEGVGFPGSIRVGYSKKLGWMVVASSSSAKVWTGLIGASTKVTRIDLAVTQKLGTAVEEVPRRYYEALSDKAKAARNYALIQNTKQGQTLYVGSRKSELFGRLYDKGVESGDAPAGFKYRWEVEYKKPTSQELAQALYAVREREAQTITAMVYDFFDARGVPPLFPKTGKAVCLDTKVRVTSHDRKLNWIRSQVQPSIKEIIMAGRTRELFEAFGIPISGEFILDLESRVQSQSKLTIPDGF